MEFGEKLQSLRKSNNLTQEELAEILYVSRTAVSKWESGKGYPAIDSLKRIAEYFSVTVDELLSADKIISIAQKENKSNISKMCDLFFGASDVCSLLFVLLPLYPCAGENYVYAVNLFAYSQISKLNAIIYWLVFSVLFIFGTAKLFCIRFKAYKLGSLVTYSSIVLSILSVLFLALSREAYATALAVVFLVIMACLYIKQMKNKLNTGHV